MQERCNFNNVLRSSSHTGSNSRFKSRGSGREAWEERMREHCYEPNLFQLISLLRFIFHCLALLQSVPNQQSTIIWYEMYSKNLFDFNQRRSSFRSTPAKIERVPSKCKRSIRHIERVSSAPRFKQSQAAKQIPRRPARLL